VEELRAEQREIDPYLVFSIKDASGNEIRKINVKPATGINRAAWDLRYPTPWPIDVKQETFNPTAPVQAIMHSLPGTYSISMDMVTRDGVKELAPAVEFKTQSLNIATLPAEDYGEVVEFQEKAGKLSNAMDAAQLFTADMQKQLVLIKQTLNKTPGSSSELMARANEIANRLEEIQFTFEGRPARASWEEIPPGPMPLNRRMSLMVFTHMSSTSGITQTERDSYDILIKEFPPVLEEIRSVHTDLKALNDELDRIGAPWTPGRMPDWN
jgi:hypothetical protein